MKYYVPIIIIGFLIICGLYFGTKNYERTASIRHSFYLNQNFDTVRKIFVRTKAADEVVKLQYAEVVEKKTTGFNFRLRPLQLQLAGWVKVKSKHEDSVMDLAQQIQITEDSLWSSYRLILPTKHKKMMHYQVLMVRDGMRTRVDVAMKITVRYTILFFYEQKADERVKAGIKEWADGIEHALTEVVGRYSYFYAQ